MSPFNHLKIVSGASLATALVLAAQVGAAHAQSGTSGLTGATPSLAGTSNTRAAGDTAGVGVGNGMDRGKPTASTFNGRTPPVGVGVLSGSPNHNGSKATVSVLNSNRLLGVSTGRVGSNGVNVPNSTHGPVVAGAASTAQTAAH